MRYRGHKSRGCARRRGAKGPPERGRQRKKTWHADELNWLPAGNQSTSDQHILWVSLRSLSIWGFRGRSVCGRRLRFLLQRRHHAPTSSVLLRLLPQLTEVFVCLLYLYVNVTNTINLAPFPVKNEKKKCDFSSRGGRKGELFVALLPNSPPPSSLYHL